MGNLLVISGPTGVGKDTMISYLVKMGWHKHPSLTTRPKRFNEVEGFDYYFIDEATFKFRKKYGELLSAVCISGYWYGFPLEELPKQLEEKDIVVNLRPEGGLLLKRIIPQATLVYLALPDKQTQVERLKMRGMSDYELQIRLRDDPNPAVMLPCHDLEFVNWNSQLTAQKINEAVRRRNAEVKRKKQGISEREKNYKRQISYGEHMELRIA